MRKIFITDKQFQYILKKLDKVCKYHESNENDNEFLEWLNSDITSLPFKIGIMIGGCESKDEFPILYFKNVDDDIGVVTVSYNPKYLNYSGINLLPIRNRLLLRQFIIDNVETLYLAGHSYYSTTEVFQYLNFGNRKKERIDEMPYGAVIISNDFKDIASLKTINKALERINKSGKIRKIIRGIYDKPEYSNVLKEYAAINVENVVNTLRRKYNWIISPSGNTALNYLHLDTQITNNPQELKYL